MELSTSMSELRNEIYVDKLILRGLKFRGFHGVNEDEKQSGQIFLVDVDAWLDLQKAGTTDNLEDTVSYTAICRVIKDVVEGQRFDLLEALANSITSAIFKKFPSITDIRVRVGKPQVAAQKMADYLGIEIFRTSPLESTGNAKRSRMCL